MKLKAQDLRPEVLAFALLMEERLREKDAEKGNSWKEMTLGELATPALSKAIFMQSACEQNQYIAASEHGVDVANYCMMIADEAGALTCVRMNDYIPCAMPAGSTCPDCSRSVIDYHGE